MDDTKFNKSIASLSDRLEFEEDIDSLIKWCKTWKLSLNYQNVSLLVSNSFK